MSHSRYVHIVKVFELIEAMADGYEYLEVPWKYLVDRIRELPAYDEVPALWHNASFDLPALGVVTFEEDDEKTEALISDPVLVYTADGRMLVAEYEEDEAFAFRGWVQTDPVGSIEGVTHWTELPRPPKGATP